MAATYCVDYEDPVSPHARQAVYVDAVGPRSAMEIARGMVTVGRVCGAYQVNPVTRVRNGPAQKGDGSGY